MFWRYRWHTRDQASTAETAKGQSQGSVNILQEREGLTKLPGLKKTYSHNSKDPQKLEKHPVDKKNGGEGCSLKDHFYFQCPSINPFIFPHVQNIWPL